ncbi:hypothetical protein C4K01_1452 [Pseudomonas synxantha]|nr:hypothetical protein C4K01_1452 [Pseudomonas synxantha]
MFVSVRSPGHGLGITDIGLGLCHCSPADSVQHQLMPELIGGR